MFVNLCMHLCNNIIKLSHKQYYNLITCLHSKTDIMSQRWHITLEVEVF